MSTPQPTLFPSAAAGDPLGERRLTAFCSASGAEVFHSIVQPSAVWNSDPFDVTTIHHDARELFYHIVERVRSKPDTPSGRILLLQGESGSGKTHLMRAFRNTVHCNGRGYCGYMQMTSAASNYARYVLSNLIDGLDRSYYLPDVQSTGLARIALGLLEAVPGISADDRERFRAGEIADLSACVNNWADRLIGARAFHDCDLDLVRAMLYLQRDHLPIKHRVLKWLRCEELSSYDRALLGDLPPRREEEKPQQMIAQLARLIAAVHHLPLVLCVDQLEDMTIKDLAADRFREVMNTLVAIAEAAPTTILVIACLEDYFKAHREFLTRPKLDRIERDPEPVRLTSQRTLDEVESLVARRLQHLYDEHDIPADEARPAFPFTRNHLQQLAGLTTRYVLDHCREHRERCVHAGAWLEPQWGGTRVVSPEPAPVNKQAEEAFEQVWNDFLAAFEPAVPDDEEELAQVLGGAIRDLSCEIPAGHAFEVDATGRMLRVLVQQHGSVVERMFIGLCEKDARGGGLKRQIGEVEKQAGEFAVVIVRSAPFPNSPTSEVSKQIARLIKAGGRRAVVEDADWRLILALRAFGSQHGQHPAFAAWRRTAQPLTQLASLRTVLNLDKLLQQQAAIEQPPAPKPPPAGVAKPAPVKPQAASAALHLGTRAGLQPTPVALDPQDLKRHMAFLGAPGSGKTTAALCLIEQLLERGIPAVLVDRKGDLSRYADPAAWVDSKSNAEIAARRQRLREMLDVVLFTPGCADGRPLCIPVVPDGLADLDSHEREEISRYAAAALGSMLQYKARSRTDQALQVILAKAIEVLAAVPGGAVDLTRLRQLVDSQDDSLVNAVDGYDSKHYKKLAEHLHTLWHQQKHLLSGTAEVLDIDLLLGRGTHAVPGKTRLSIINVQFLADDNTREFWVAQFLLELSRWRGKNPASQLQCVFLFDEADKYLPAIGQQPATKLPMEDLLRRGRSAGIGMFLATQSPGDFDYRCRDNILGWLVGKVKEDVAIRKLKSMFSESKIDVAAKLPQQQPGEFYLLREKDIIPVQTSMSLIATEQLSEDRIRELARAGKIK